MLSNGTFAMGKRYANPNFMVEDILLTEVEGKLSHFVLPNSEGFVLADMVKNRIGPGAAIGSIVLNDGNADIVLEIPAAEIHVEEGPRDGNWHTRQSFFAKGLANNGAFYIMSSLLAEQSDTGTLFYVAFAVSDKPGAEGFGELAAWWMKGK